MKDVSKSLFDIAESHPHAFLRLAASYELLQPYHFIRRPRNVLTDPSDALTAAVESLIELVQEPARYINHGYRYKEGAMGHAQVPQCPAPSERNGFGNVAKLLPPTSRVPLPLEYLYLWT
ncbi:hypothetical protein EVAR_38252_1 [Eumeta japonica]|uniref:Uncharacterized protein n=1 Tax=Eumeta variegata TaxID=151549 RepID=A0A4C1YBA8_EUMVA|nr:hypothetical protein EVAR_38252_1 [Eumeta japonica]